MKKEIEKKEEIEETEKDSSTRRKKELYWIFGVMISLIAVFLVTSSVIHSMRKFEYNGMTFTKSTIGGQIPIYVYSYNSVITGAVSQTKGVNLALRHDPRENNILVEGDEVQFPKGKTAYVSINGEGLQCEYSQLAVGSLSMFLSSNGVNVKGALQDEKEAEESGLPYVTCESHPTNPVINLQSGEQTKITIKGLCYTIEVANCEVLQAIEKLEVQTIIDGKERASLAELQ